MSPQEFAALADGMLCIESEDKQDNEITLVFLNGDVVKFCLVD